MSRVHLFFPGNVTAHAEVLPDKRRLYAAEFGEVMHFLSEAPMRFSVAFHGVDFDFTGKPKNIPAVRLHNAAYNHLLPTHFEKSPNLGDHLRKMYAMGVTDSPYALFNAEFDIYRFAKTAPESDPLPQVMFALATGDTFLYSTDEESQMKAAGAFVSTAPVWFHDKIVVPMYGVGEAQKAFFRWQRLPTAQNADLLVVEFSNLIHDDDEENIKVFFMDLEAPIVGSERGLVETWSAFFDLMKVNGFDSYFVGLPEASEFWRSRAVKPPQGTNRLFMRQTGSKWTWLHTQIDWLMKIAAGRKPVTLADQVAWSFVTTSDVLAVMNRQMRGDTVLQGMRREIRISVNPDVITVAETCFRALERGSSAVKPEDLLIRLKHLSPDSAWYVRRVADVIASYR